MENFNLKDYAAQIIKMYEIGNIDPSEAVENFILNLNTMSDYKPGAEDLNFRALGQKWNALNYKVRNKQKAEVIELVSKKALSKPRKEVL